MLPICYEKQSQLSQQYQQASLAHALLIQGVTGSGNEGLAQWLINLLLCKSPTSFVRQKNDGTSSQISQACDQCKACLLRQGGNYPDHLLLTSENKTLGVDDIRRGNTFLEKTAQLGKVKTILIPQAQSMTIAAANALLKTLEEPTDNSYIVLITEDLDSLLPTIVSRCAVFSIRPNVGEALLAQLNILHREDNTMEVSDINNITNEKAFVNISQLPELTDVEIFNAFKLFKARFINFLYEGTGEDHLLSQLIDNKHGLRWVEKIITNLIRQQSIKQSLNIIDKPTSPLSEKKISLHELNQIYQTIINSNKLIKSYIQANKQYVGEQLLMTINQIVRPQ